MPQLPRGTVTLLFTDIEGSTRLLHAIGGDAYADALAEHRAALREAFRRLGGAEVDAQGDALFYAFPRAADALKAAEEAHGRLASGPVRVRIGIHTGEPRLTAEGYVGVDVHKAARIMSAAHGGQTLVSESTRRLVDAAFPLQDLGPQRLKDMTAVERLYQLGNADFPPPRTLNQTNLPVAAGRLIGRERELAKVLELLRGDHRAVTVTGPGGSGKTRLAQQAAAEVIEDYGDGVFWVPLAGVGDPALLTAVVGQALGAQGDLRTFLASRQTLLLLDNFEQLLAAAADVSDLLAGAPDVKVLVTSRAPLRIAGEQEYPLDPLGETDAATLFVERAREAGRAVAIETHPIVREICRRLDNLPLAIELAAARTKLLAPAALLSRLEHRLPVLTGGRRDAPDRHRTLRGAIEWSYDLLNGDARDLFARLAVFNGSFSADAAERVCDADLERLGALVEFSLLKPVGDDRFLMLETIREFARERLDERIDGEDALRRHARYFRDVANATNLAADAEGEERHDVARLEADNLRAALDWASRAGEIELAVEIGVGLEHFWVTTTDLCAESVRRFRDLLDRASDLPLLTRGRLLRGYAGSVDFFDKAEAERFYRQSLACFEELGDRRRMATLLHRLAYSALARRDFASARGLAERSLAINRDTGDRKGEALGYAMLGSLAREAGDSAAALVHYTESHAAARDAGWSWWAVRTLVGMAGAEWKLGRFDDAERHAREALEGARRISDRYTTVAALASLARNATAAGSVRRAGRLWGAIEAEERRGAFSWAFDREQAERDAVGAAGAEFDEGRAEGRRLALDEAVAEALAPPARIVSEG